jgi:transcriptional regulator with XRE-family HTH domain
MSTVRTQHTSSLRVTRDATGLSQIKFAEQVGAPRAVIENVEMGRSKLTRELAQRISAFTGVDGESLRTKQPMDLSGQPYTKESWLDWQKAKVPVETVSFWVKRAQDHLALALNAAHRNPGGVETPHKLKALYCSFSDWLMNTADALKIRDGIEKILVEHFSQTHPRHTATMGAVRRALGHNPAFQARDKPQWKDDAIVEVEEIVSPRLVPLTAFILVNGKSGIAEQSTQRRTMRIIFPGGELFQVSEDEMNLNVFAGAALAGEIARVVSTTPPPSGQPSPPPAPPVESPKTPPQPSASPKRGSARTKSASRPGGPSRKR